MSFDINQLKPDEKQLLFKNLVTCDFTMMRGKQPESNDPIWGENGPPQAVPRKSPYRSSSNANFLLHNNDEVCKIMPATKRIKLYKQNNVIEPDKMKGHEIEIEAEKAELAAAAAANKVAFQNNTTLSGELKSNQDSKSLNKQKQLQQAAHLTSEGTCTAIAARSDVASSSMNPTVDLQFGLLEEDPAVQDLPAKKQFDKYQNEINYDETYVEQKRAETSDQIQRNRKSSQKNDPKNIKSRQQKAEDIVAQREKQFQIAKKYKNQVNESIQRDRVIKTRGHSRGKGMSKLSDKVKNVSPEKPKSKSDAIAKAKARRQEAKVLAEAARLEAERPKDAWDEIMELDGQFVEVDGRQINLASFPKGFDFELIRGMMIAPNEQLYNYNNMVMEQTIVDVNSIVSKRKPPDSTGLTEKFRDTQRVRYWNDKYRANQQELMDKKLYNSEINDHLLATQLPAYFDGIYKGQIIYNMLSWPAQRSALGQNKVDLARSVQLETEEFKNIDQRNSFKVRGGPSYQQSPFLSQMEQENKSFMQKSQMETERKNEYYQVNHKYMNPKSQRDYQDELEPQFLEALSRQRNLTSLSQRVQNREDVTQRSNIKQVLVPNYGAQLPQFELKDIEEFQKSVEAHNQRTMSPKSKEKYNLMNYQYDKTQETEFETFRDTLQSSTRKDDNPSQISKRPNLAKIIGTPAAIDGIQPLISPNGNSIDGSAEYISDILSMNQAFQQSVMQSKRGKSTLEQNQLPDLLSTSQFSSNTKRKHIETMNNQMQFLKINKKFRGLNDQQSKEHIDQLKNKQTGGKVNAIQLNNNTVKTDSKHYQLNSNNTFSQTKYAQTIEDLNKSIQQPSFFGCPVDTAKTNKKPRQFSLTDKFARDFIINNTKNQELNQIKPNEHKKIFPSFRRGMNSQNSPRFGTLDPSQLPKKRMQLFDSLTKNVKQGGKIQDHMRNFDLENSFFIPVMVNYNQRRRVKKVQQDETKYNTDLPIKIDISSLGKKNAGDNTPILLLNGTGIQGSPPQSQRKQLKNQDEFKNASNVPTNAINSNLSFNAGDSQHGIRESVTKSEASGREGAGFKSGGSKYLDSSIHMGTEQKSREKPVDTKGSIKDDGVDLKDEYEILASIAESANSSKDQKQIGEAKYGKGKVDQIFGESLMKYQFNAKTQIQQEKYKQELQDRSMGTHKINRDSDLRVDGQHAGVRPQTQAKDSMFTTMTRIIEPTSHVSQNSSILEKIASKENCKSKGGAHMGKAQIAVNQRARTREQNQRQKSRQAQSRSDSRQNPGVRIKNVSSGGRTLKDSNNRQDQNKQNHGMQIETGGKHLHTSPGQTEPETALLDKKGNKSIDSPSPVGSRGARADSNMNTRRTRNHQGSVDLQQNSTGNNTKRTSVLKVKDGEQIKTNRIYKGQIAMPIVYKRDSENNSQSSQSQRIEALKLAELYRRQQKEKDIQHAQQYGQCFASLNNDLQTSDPSTARFFSQQSPRTKNKMRQQIGVTVGRSAESGNREKQEPYNFTSDQRKNAKGNFHLGVTGNIKAYGVSVVNQKRKNPQFGDFKVSNQYQIASRGAASQEPPTDKLQKKYDYEAEKKKLTFRSKNIDKEIFARKGKHMQGVEAEDKGGPGTVLSHGSSLNEGQSPTDQRANEQSRSLEQVHGARMQPASQISQESVLSGPMQINSKYTKIVTNPSKSQGRK